MQPLGGVEARDIRARGRGLIPIASIQTRKDSYKTCPCRWLEIVQLMVVPAEVLLCHQHETPAYCRCARCLKRVQSLISGRDAAARKPHLDFMGQAYHAAECGSPACFGGRSGLRGSTAHVIQSSQLERQTQER